MNKVDQTVKRKAYFGLFWLIVIMSLLFFLPAGTFNYWQAWVYLIIFGTSSLLITLFLMKKDVELLKRRIHAGAAAENERIQKIIQAFAQLIFIGIMIIPGFDHRFAWSDVPVYLEVTGDIFVALGFFIVFLVFKENTFTSAIIEIAENQKVISTGPYKFVRHPMYSGALLLLIFTPFALGSFWAFPFVIVMIIIIIYRLLDEEKFLSKNLDGYKSYCQKTRFRLIPRIW
ncbi:MAG TPA: isoprenylcysteine carboxylmethyltransferase family protein [Puia sp.]|nr:isoprenylcysteine carboxylmethyltransferase family protein [Puia sp.]